MNEVAHQLCRALRIRAARCRFPLHTRDNFPARRARFRQTVRHGILRVRDHGNDLRDDLARLSDNDTRADANIFFRDEILVVQRRAADRRTG